jgi:hypothetical protein
MTNDNKFFAAMYAAFAATVTYWGPLYQSLDKQHPTAVGLSTVILISVVHFFAPNVKGGNNNA